MHETRDVLETMKRLAVEAGQEILRFYQKEVAVEYKQDQSPVTDADKTANEMIVEGLKSSYPDIPVLAEESRDDSSRLGKRFCFIVDPLDGTKEFLKKNGEFTVNIALAEEGRPIAGVIYVPVLKELYAAGRGIGAYSVIGGCQEKLSVSQRIGGIRLAKSRTHHAPEMEKLIEENGITDIIVAGSAYKGCLLARGDVEAYYRFGRTMEWDTAAMEIIILEAGGLFSGMDGRTFLYNKENSENPTGFFALNKKENTLKLSGER